MPQILKSDKIAQIWYKDSKTVLKIEIRHTVHDLWASHIYVNT